MKRIAALACLLDLVLLFSSCSRETRYGVFELERRLKEVSSEYAFDSEDMFRKEGVYHIYYCTEKGTMLLKAGEDERRRLQFLSLTTTDVEAADLFSAFSCTLIDMFIPEDARADVRAALLLEDPGSFFVDETLTAEYGRYKAVFFKSVKGVSLMLKYE